VSDDEGFGPPARGGRGGRSRSGTQPPPVEPAPPPAHDDDFGPVLRGRRRRRLARRGLRTVLLTLLVLLLVLALTGTALALVAVSRIDRVDVRGLQAAGAPLNVLLVGSDSRADLSDEQRREWRTGSAEGLRTDTILLLSVSGGRAALLSFPRDLFVTRCDGTEGRINAAYNIDGPSCLVETVTQLSGIPVDR
jgi:anionic cell wall polymer biosynthesis LytR-Cps2A-Psr (LCP) family protein